MPVKSKIETNLELLNGASWADRLEAIEFLKNLSNKDDIVLILKCAINLESFNKYNELIQIYESIIKDSHDINCWQGAFWGIFELATILKDESDDKSESFLELIDEMLEDLIKILIGEKKSLSSPEHKRPELIFALARVWPTCSKDARFLMVKKIIKFKLKELYNLAIEGLEYGDTKSQINILRVLIHAKDKRLIPALKNWLEGEDEVRKVEALIAMRRVGGLIEVPFIKSYLKDKNPKVRIEACLTILRIFPFGRVSFLQNFWVNEDELINQRKLIQFLGNQNRFYSLKFLISTLMGSFDSSLESNLLNAISKIRHSRKVSILSSVFKKVIEEKKLLILMALKGKPYQELEAFYHQELDKVKNPILKVLILESLAGFDSTKTANFLYQYVKTKDDYTCSAAFTSLMEVEPGLAGTFICEEFIHRENLNQSLMQAFFKNIPIMHAHIKLNRKLRSVLREQYRNGSRNEKTFLLRALPYLLDASLFNFVVKDFIAKEDSTLTALQGSAIIKCSFLKTSFVEHLIPLMSDDTFIRLFNREKLKPKFCEALGFVLLQNSLLETPFITSVLESVVKVFLNRMAEFEIPAVIIFYLKTSSQYSHLIEERHFELAQQLFSNSEIKPIRQSFIRFNLLRGDLESFKNFLNHNQSFGALESEANTIKQAIGL